MKRQKRSMLQRMMAALLTALLVVSIASNAVPVAVLAQEDTASSVSGGRQESTVGNTEEPAEENTKPEEKAPAPAETTNPEEPTNAGGGVKPETPTPEEEPKQETPVPEEEPKQETPKADGETAEQETVSGNDAQPEIVAEPQGVMMAAEAASGTCGDNLTWTLADGVLTISGTGAMTNWGPGESPFKRSDIKTVVINKGVTSIGEYAFYECSGLTSITIPAGVTDIGVLAFYKCSELTSITIPASTANVYSYAFQGCSSLNDVTMQGETPPKAGVDVFADCKFVKNDRKGIHVLAGTAETYKAAEGWAAWAEYIVDDAASAEEHEHDGVTFTPWKETDKLPTDAGNYYLTDNVTLSDQWFVPSGTTNLCLNGKTISNNGNLTVIAIGSSHTLHLYDCQNTGNITGGKRGGVDSAGTFHMYGGKISGNTGDPDGGGVVVRSGTFQMHGGEISGNTAAVGGGVSVNGGTFQMHGGKISGNTVAYGGGVYVGGTFEMDGGEISGNTAADLSGGVRVSGTFAVGGGAVISGNTADGAASNIYLMNGRTITVASEKPLSGSAKIGVTTYPAPTEGSPVDITGHNKGDYSSYFTSDNPAYEIVNANDVVQLAVKSQTHTHNLTLTPAKPATCTENGNAAYYTCDGCDKWFLDAAGTQEITDKTSVVISKREHEYDETAWGYRAAEGHAHKCKNCDAHDTVQPHTPGAAATESTPQTCTVCGYIIAPATGAEPGNVTPEVRPGANAPETNISTPAEDLREMLLTDDEKQQVQNGTDVKIILDIKDAGSTVSDSDKAAIQQALNGFTVGQYLNIDLYKLIGGDRTDMHETAGKIRIVIKVPDSLRNTSSKKTRTFAVIRVHNGSAELLTDLDNSADTITMETDRFSTYAIVYKDTANGGSGDGGDDDNGGGSGDGGGDNGSGGNSSGGDNSNGNGSNGGSADPNGGNNSNGGGNGNGGADHNGGNNGTGSNSGAGVGGSKNSSHNNLEKISAGQGSAKDDEPETGDTAPLELCATLAMIAGIAYLLLYFTDRERGMTEETKKEMVSRLIRWARQGGRGRKYLALAAIFALLVYYHSIGKRMCVRWKAVYGE